MDEGQQTNYDTSSGGLRMARLKFLIGMNEPDEDDSGVPTAEYAKLKQLNTDNSVVENISKSENVDDDEILYQNNVQSVFAGSNTVCTECKETTVNTNSVSNISTVTFNTHLTSSEVPTEPIDNKLELLGGRYRKSIEITATSNIKTGLDGVPLITFSFHQTNDNNELSQLVNDASDDSRSLNRELALEHYDFPKNILRSASLNCIENGSDSIKCKTDSKSLYDVRDDKNTNDIYDLPKRREMQLNAIIDDKRKEKNESETDLSREVEDCHYEVLSRPPVSLKSSIGNLSDDARAEAYRDSSYGLSKSCLDSHHRVKKHGLGKAWNKMRSWLRDERIKFNEVVQNHARMQAVGAIYSESHSNENSMSSSRCGSYDLVAARARELGIESPMHNHNELVLEVVSEDFHQSECNEAVVSRHDLATNSMPYFFDSRVDDDGKVDKKSPEIINTTLPQKTASSNSIVRDKKLKLAPGVSFSLDNLCNDDSDDEDEKNEQNDSEIVYKKEKNLNTVTMDNEQSHRKTRPPGKRSLIRRRMFGSIRGLMSSTNLLHQHDSEEVDR